MARRITILGATGSVGRSTLDLIEREGEGAFDIVALTANSDVAGLAELARKFRPERAVIGDSSRYDELKTALAGTNVGVSAGCDAIVEAAGAQADWTMAAIVGTAGLAPVMRALEGGGIVALANKEALVSAGALMTEAARRSGATLLPVDSEHNAVFQCLHGSRAAEIRRIILTASGGPFRSWTLDEMRAATPEQAVAHPNWSMGAKISVDSATLMNKGLELIEAYHLFPVGPGQLEAVVHPQSIVHSLVEYCDGSLLAQLGPADMRVPIAYTLAWPQRMATPCTGLDLATIARLDFEAPDLERFPALSLARQALADGGAKPAILNASNEVAVASFLARSIGFLDIAAIVGDVMAAYDPPTPATIEDVLEIDAEARAVARQVTGKIHV
ncbi:MAG: 1-deoxy-D-xylulose-5-phosphate reductoisomerase [Allosphingosinicella sp.]|uniref:1-deoxy-D-xylulose-5-phosphate reductoisomerase n=1 Tax=Allosphingosinicella sp. TaxID=2823234 RepID=UPI0039496BAF